MGCLGRLLAILREEYRWKSWKFTDADPNLFLTSEWQDHGRLGVRAWYMVYRWMWSLYHLAWLIVCLVNEGGASASLKRKLFFFIYLTNWGYINIVILTTYQAILVTMHWYIFRRTGQRPTTLPTSMKVLWVLQTVVYLPAFLITAAYWTSIYDPEEQHITPQNADVHIMNSVYVFVDLWIVASPVRLAHFYVPLSFLCTYGTFSLIYWAAGGTTPNGETAIYPILDWDNLGVTLPFVITCAVLNPFMQAAVWLIYKLRVALRRLMCGLRVTPSLPHQGTMDVILERDQSFESANPPMPMPRPIISQTV